MCHIREALCFVLPVLILPTSIPGCIGSLDDEASSTLSGSVTERGPRIMYFARYPVHPSLYIPGSHLRRYFYRDGNHLGEDIALPVGTPVRPIGPGRIVHYRAQGTLGTGYGELYVGIEHDLGREFEFLAGAGTMTRMVRTRYILSVYGHLRKSRERDGPELPWRVGDWVTEQDIIGYVNDSMCPEPYYADPDDHNGDGLPHLHLGIRLMSEAQARRVDGGYYLRGYDNRPGEGSSRLLDFGEPREVIHRLAFLNPPVGILVKLPDDSRSETIVDSRVYLRDDDGRLRWLETEDDLRSRRLYLEPGDPFGRVLPVEDVSCVAHGSVIDLPVTMRVTTCNRRLGWGMVTETFLTIDDRGEFSRYRIPFESSQHAYHALLRSYGFSHLEVLSEYVGCEYPVRGQLYLRDGVLVREHGQSDFTLITNGGIAYTLDAEVARQMGFDLEGDSSDVIMISDGSTSVLARGFGGSLDVDSLRVCPIGGPHPVTTVSTADCVDGLSSYPDEVDPDIGGGGGDCPDADGDGYLSTSCGGRDCDDADPASWPDAAERCDGRDNDCDLLVDEPFDLASDDLNCGRCGNACSGDAHCVSGACIAGGCTADAQCGDRDDCIHDWCDASHRCQHRPLDERCPSGQYCHPTSGCMPHGYCTLDEHCTYDVACTADRCVGTSCVHTPDDSRCDALHSCSAAYGCQLRDTDGDGITDIGDCAPTDPERAIAGPESCNGLDDDCDGLVDEGVCAPLSIDAGTPDAGTDAGGRDAGPPDTGTRDGGIDPGRDADSGGMRVEVRWCPGASAFLETDLPDRSGWSLYPYPPHESCAWTVFTGVRRDLYRVQGIYPRSTGVDFECEGTAATGCRLRRGVVPEVLVDGVPMSVVCTVDSPEPTASCVFILNLR